MRDKIKKYATASTIDGILCGILIFALLHTPLNYIALFTFLALAVVAFGTITLSRKEPKEKARRMQQITNFTVGLTVIVYAVAIINIIKAVVLLIEGRL
jgi:hypothetical protein